MSIEEQKPNYPQYLFKENYWADVTYEELLKDTRESEWVYVEKGRTATEGEMHAHWKRQAEMERGIYQGGYEP